MRLRLLAPLALIALAPSIPRPLGACSLASRDGGGWYEQPILGDSQPPTDVNVTYEIERPLESDEASIGCNSSCGAGPGYVVLQLTATDNLAPVERIGYKFEIVGGQPPRQLQYDQVLTVDPYSASGTELALLFDRTAAPFSFDLQITAIDLNGNESTPVVVTVDG